MLGLSKGLRDTLVTGLKSDSPDADAHEFCATLAAENPKKRKNLVACQKESLWAVQYTWSKKGVIFCCLFVLIYYHSPS